LNRRGSADNQIIIVRIGVGQVLNDNYSHIGVNVNYNPSTEVLIVCAVFCGHAVLKAGAVEKVRLYLGGYGL
jgi:hypothetical protein